MNNKLFKTPNDWSFPGIIQESFSIMDLQKKGHLFNRETGLPCITPSSHDFKTMPWNELEKFSDVVTNAFPDATAIHLQDVMNTNPHELNLNVTSLGNLAFISNHAVMPVNRNMAKELLSTYIQNKIEEE